MSLLIEKHIALAPYTTLHVGGVAAYFHRLTREEDLIGLIDLVRENKVAITVLGGGSNVLIADGELKRLVIKNELRGITMEADKATESVLVTAAAGEPWDAFVAYVVEQGLAGLENLSGIPGTVGAAPIQNINAYGAQVADVIESVRVFDPITKTFHVLSCAECQFGYRDSVFKTSAGSEFVVTAVTFRLLKGYGVANLKYRSASQSIAKYVAEQGIVEPTLSDIRAAILHVRSNIGMLEGQFRSAGSFFKNTIVSADEYARINEIVKERFVELDTRLAPWNWPLANGEVKISTAFLMECSPYNKRTYGEKRWRGVVGLSPKHSLSVVTEEGATAADVRAFVAEIIAAVKKIFDVTIETEVNLVRE
jgi:UDP-N-acetylmuramate dehydrogenase